MTPGTEVMNQVQEKLVGAEPGNSAVSEDGKWTLPAHGGKLKRGNIGPGRPKKEIRDLALRGAESAVKQDLKTLADENAPSEAKEKARDRLYRFGLGLKDEVQMQDREAFLRSLARATVRLKYSDADSAKLLEVVADELGIE